MLRNFFSLYFWVTFVALTIASGLFWLGSFRHVEGEVMLLMLPKTDTAIVAPENAKTLLFSESFQKQVRGELDKTASPEFASLEGKEWQEAIHGELLPGSSILRLTAARETRGEAKTLLDSLTKQLVNRLGQFYNFESELDIRIIDGPRFETRVSSWLLFSAASIGSGFMVTTLFFLLLSLIEGLVSKRPFKEAEKVYHISPDTFRPKAVAPYWSQQEEAAPGVEPESISEQAPVTEEVYSYEETFSDPNPAEVTRALPEEMEETDEFQEEVAMESEVVEETKLRGMATGPAPDNLPIAPDLSPLEEANARLFKADIDETAELQATLAEKELEIPVTPAPPQIAEPSQEEYKRRLNELLSGKL